MLKHGSVYWPVGGGLWGRTWLKNNWFFKVFRDFEGSRSEVVLGGSWEASGGALGGGFGAVLGDSWAPLGCLLGCLGRVWDCLAHLSGCFGRFLGCLGRLLGCLGAYWAVLGPSRGPKRPPRHLKTPPGRPRDLPNDRCFCMFLHMFIHSQGFRPEMGSNMGSKNGVQK